MATYTKGKLSESTNGRGIKVVATGTAGTLIHTACAGTTNWDVIWIKAQNNHTAAVTLTIEWGNASTDDNIIMTIPAKSGLYMVVDAGILQNGLEVRAFASTANVIILHGEVDHCIYA